MHTGFKSCWSLSVAFKSVYKEPEKAVLAVKLVVDTHSAAGAYAKARTRLRHTMMGLDQEARTRANYGLTGICGDPGYQCVFLWLHILALDVHTAMRVEVRMGMCRYMAFVTQYRWEKWWKS